MQGILPVMPAIKESKDDHLISIVPTIVDGSLSDKSKNSIENNAEIKNIDINMNVAKEQKGSGLD